MPQPGEPLERVRGVDPRDAHEDGLRLGTFGFAAAAGDPRVVGAPFYPPRRPGVSGACLLGNVIFVTRLAGGPTHRPPANEPVPALRRAQSAAPRGAHSRFLLSLLAAVVPSTAVSASVLPDRFQESAVITALLNPTAIRFAPNGQIFVAEKSGRRASARPRIVVAGAVLPQDAA